MVRKPVRPPLPPSRPTPALPAATFPANRRRPLIIKETAKLRARLAEAAGATAAACAALCCCCPCGLVKLLIVVVLKLPAALVRRALRRRRKRRTRGVRAKASLWSSEADAFHDDNVNLYHGVSEEAWPAKSPSPELAELENRRRRWRRNSTALDFGGASHKGSESETLLPKVEEKKSLKVLSEPSRWSPTLTPLPRVCPLSWFLIQAGMELKCMQDKPSPSHWFP